jgi:hypothetical protein
VALQEGSGGLKAEANSGSIINMLPEDRSTRRRVKHEEDYEEDFEDLYDSPPHHERLNARSRSNS